MAKKTNKEEVSNLPSTRGQFDLSNMTQENIPELLQVVVDKIASIKKGLPDAPKATEQLPGFGYIKDIKDTATLIHAYSSVSNREKHYYEAAAELNVKGKTLPKFKLGNTSAEDWKTDIKARINVVIHQTELDKLNKMKDKLESNLSVKDKLARDLAEIAKMAMDDDDFEQE